MISITNFWTISSSLFIFELILSHFKLMFCFILSNLRLFLCYLSSLFLALRPAKPGRLGRSRGGLLQRSR